MTTFYFELYSTSHSHENKLFITTFFGIETIM